MLVNGAPAYRADHSSAESVSSAARNRSSLCFFCSLSRARRARVASPRPPPPLLNLCRPKSPPQLEKTPLGQVHARASRAALFMADLRPVERSLPPSSASRLFSSGLFRCCCKCIEKARARKKMKREREKKGEQSELAAPIAVARTQSHWALEALSGVSQVCAPACQKPIVDVALPRPANGARRAELAMGALAQCRRPGRAEPSRAEPSRAEPSRAEPS